MTPNPIRKVLLTMRTNRVRALLMGGQACVFYGGAEFSRDTDLAILPSSDNLERVQAALTDLLAKPVAVPPLTLEYLHKGHAVHFRCHHPEAAGQRIDLMSVLRGVAPFDELWARRTTIEVGEGERYDLLALPDLVRAKKTQRDKDWPMIRRMLEAHYLEHRERATPEHVRFWLCELRTPRLLIEAARRHPAEGQREMTARPLIAEAVDGDETALAEAIANEEHLEREQDRAYWRPLREELERLRHRTTSG